MKKIILIGLVAFLISFGTNAQVQVNVHIFGGNERLYFAHPHSWMVSHGYYYNNNGYYVQKGGKRINPNRREPYHRKGNNGNHYGQHKMKGNGNRNGHSNGHGNGHKGGKGGKGHK